MRGHFALKSHLRVPRWWKMVVCLSKILVEVEQPWRIHGYSHRISLLRLKNNTYTYPLNTN